ncbi:hypothetical protein LXM26_28715 [Dyadobacter sp. LJ419]|uniref:Uncharacterized protein n=1 Tax=Dyadobacter chenwenxiniae TaxID=2906456 RepID=A0A9X1THW5_9BACT|nr:hypothetical protein [Dyadobacter chenwenxiniae]MCF0065532.1 hypothetical protein [Dyadobacter chenwenxiniae]
MGKSTNASDRTDINTRLIEEEKQHKRLEELMVKVAVSPKDWTTADLQKLKADPKAQKCSKRLCVSAMLFMVMSIARKLKRT